MLTRLTHVAPPAVVGSEEWISFPFFFLGYMLDTLGFLLHCGDSTSMLINSTVGVGVSDKMAECVCVRACARVCARACAIQQFQRSCRAVHHR